MTGKQAQNAVLGGGIVAGSVIVWTGLKAGEKVSPKSVGSLAVAFAGLGLLASVAPEVGVSLAVLLTLAIVTSRIPNAPKKKGAK